MPAASQEKPPLSGEIWSLPNADSGQTNLRGSEALNLNVKTIEPS